MNTNEEPTLTQLMRHLVRNLLKDHSARQVGKMLEIDHMAVKRFTRAENPGGLNSRSFDWIAQFFNLALYYEDD